MELSMRLAKNLRALYFGKNWTAVNYKDALEDVKWEEANQSVGGLNSIATLVYHTMYYMKVQIPVIDGKALNASDKESFVHEPLTSQPDWMEAKKEMFALAERLAAKMENLPGHIYDKPFGDEKWGSYYRNLQGTIEHSHYHLGQIVVLKKLIRSEGTLGGDLKGSLN